MNTQIPMPVNGISTPFSVDENIASMKKNVVEEYSTFGLCVPCGLWRL